MSVFPAPEASVTEALALLMTTPPDGRSSSATVSVAELSLVLIALRPVSFPIVTVTISGARSLSPLDVAVKVTVAVCTSLS